MNLAQIRTVVRDMLTAGGGTNNNVGDDDFWGEAELNFLINEGQKELWKIIRRSRADYFIRIIRSTDAPLLIHGQVFNPASLRWQPNVGNYTLPPDFTRMKLMTDLSADRIRVIFGDIARNEFKVLMNETGGNVCREYVADILGLRSLIIRPFPIEQRDFEFIYERTLPILRDWVTGTVTVANGNTTATFSASADIQNRLEVGDELIVGTATQQAAVDPNVDYPQVLSIDSSTQVTLDRPYLGVDATAVMFRISSTPHIPRAHQDLLVTYGVKEGFRKGTNPSKDGVALWSDKWGTMVPSLINDVEIRQGSDIETTQPFMEDLYDV